jgi:hypothetical protein
MLPGHKTKKAGELSLKEERPFVRGRHHILTCRSHEYTDLGQATIIKEAHSLTRPEYRLKCLHQFLPTSSTHSSASPPAMYVLPLLPYHHRHQIRAKLSTTGRRCPRKTKRQIRRLPPRPKNVLPPPTSRRNKTLRTSLHSPNGRCQRHFLTKAIPTFRRWS